jgi:tRNA (adenine37-N6)-methyltransferase
MNSDAFKMIQVGVIRSPYKSKFGIPRQPGLAPSVKSEIHFNHDPEFAIALKGLQDFTHLWVIFLFHEHGGKRWRPQIRPPRLGGKTKMGVFASRTPHRPNPIGISAVVIEKVDLTNPKAAVIEISGGDFLDGTPVLDVKPYIAYTDSIPEAKSAWAAPEIIRQPVEFTEISNQKLLKFKDVLSKDYQKCLIEVLGLDPRPAFQRANAVGSHYSFTFMNTTVLYQVLDNTFLVHDIQLLNKLNH